MCHWLHAHGVPLLDAQVTNDHLMRMGAREMPRGDFLVQAEDLVNRPPGALWQVPSSPRPVATLLDQPRPSASSVV
jgi:Leu/Phe-tRNA-protein transferase